MNQASWILTLTCVDRVGIVAGVTGFLARNDGFILDSQQYADLETGRFFMRVVFTAGGPGFPEGRDALVSAFLPVAAEFGLDWGLSASDEKPRLVVAVSKGSHCLNDLLHRQQSGTLSAQIVAVDVNPAKAEVARRFGATDVVLVQPGTDVVECYASDLRLAYDPADVRSIRRFLESIEINVPASVWNELHYDAATQIKYNSLYKRAGNGRVEADGEFDDAHVLSTRARRALLVLTALPLRINMAAPICVPLTPTRQCSSMSSKLSR